MGIIDVGEPEPGVGTGSRGSADAERPGESERGPQRLLELDGIRGLAAVAVMCGHWVVASPGATGPVSGPVTSAIGWMLQTPLSALIAGSQMVILFFVLSGMVLALPWLAGRNRSYGRYLVTRALRLYPVAWVAAALGAAILVLTGSDTAPGLSPWLSIQLHAPLPPLSLVHFAGLIWPFDPSRLDAPLWSLEQELRLSLLLPLLVLVVRRSHRLIVVLIAVCLIVEGTASTWVLASWSWTPVAAGCFLLGVLVARHREALNHRWAHTSAPARSLVWLGVLFSFWIPMRYGDILIVNRLLFNLLPALGACALLVAAQGPGLAIWLRGRVPAWLGRISYSLYVIHIVVMHLLAGICPAGVPMIDLAPVGIGLSLALATVMQRYVEVPAVALGRRVVASSPGRGVATSAVRA